MRAAVALAVSVACGAGAASAQGIDGKVGRFYQEQGWTLYRLGVSRSLAGPLGTSIHGDYMERVGGADGKFAGAGFDVTAFRGGAGPYLVAGLAAGMGSPRSNAFSSTWTSWSAGAGYELVPASFVRFSVEGRWREISLDRRTGLELAAGLSFNLGGGRKAHPQAPPVARAGDAGAGDPPLRTTSLPATPRIATTAAATAAALADSVIATATEVMGRPYQYGGTGAGGDGFDCSGLIQYAYGRHGITLPRTSAEQARQGTAVKKNVMKLAPGDLLTFSNRGGPVTHVGLYIGEGRFIHSATRGVQVSVLSGDDPYGRWWYVRWVGVRRIVE